MQHLEFRMSILLMCFLTRHGPLQGALGMSTAQIADVWHMNVTEVVRLLNQAGLQISGGWKLSKIWRCLRRFSREEFLVQCT